MQNLSVVYHRPTGLWFVLDENNVYLCAFTLERHAVHFARYGSIGLEEMK